MDEYITQVLQIVVKGKINTAIELSMRDLNIADLIESIQNNKDYESFPCSIKNVLTDTNVELNIKGNVLQIIDHGHCYSWQEFHNRYNSDESVDMAMAISIELSNEEQKQLLHTLIKIDN